MKKLLLSIFAFASLASSASLSITGSDLKWTIGNEWYMDVTSGKSIGDFTSTGTGINWDLTSYEGKIAKDTIKVAAATGGIGSTVMISSNIIPETNYAANGNGFDVTTLYYNLNYNLDAGLTLGFDHAAGSTWSGNTAVGGFIPVTVAGEVLASGSVTTSYGTFDALLVKDEYNISGNIVTYYYWETKEYGRIATIIEGNLMVMTQNNFNVIVSTNEASVTGFNVYPNPTSSNFTVKADALENVKIFDAIGNLVVNEIATSNTVLVDATSFNAGVYFVQATANGIATTSRVVVK